MKKYKLASLLCACFLFLFAACAKGGKSAPSPSPSPSPTPATVERVSVKLPRSLETDGSVPSVRVYVTETETVEEMDMEEYLCGVLAGEMRADWPMEALKAQALLARTFALYFLLEKGGSRYEGADLSTDVEEAQAYDASGVDERIRRAIRETEGQVIVDESGAPIQSWFHSHSGGVTAMAKEGLDYEDEEPACIRSVRIEESDKAPEECQSWTAYFSFEEVNKALEGLGGGDASALAIEETGPSGRVTLFSAGENSVSAPSLRLALGGTRMRSTLLTDMKVEDGYISMSGRGYGHGVGMSQWGAYALAEQGKDAQEIIESYFAGVRFEKAWG